MNTHFEFLLFSYLLRFVHREGRTGDFARAGLLFLFDIAFLAGEEGDGLIMTPAVDGSDPMQDARDALAEYILDGDFADVMAAGLGAAFSVLPSKVRIPNLAEQAREDPALNASGGMHIGAAEDVDPDDELMELPSSTDMDVRSQLDLLLKLLGFLQDILYRCRSSIIHSDPNARTVSATQALGPAVADAALDAVQTAFVDNVLYPSILECSSTDGSAVAVLTYLDVLLANLDYGPVLQRILDVLSDADGATPLMAQNKNRKQRKTGAMDYVAQTSPTTQRAEYFHDEGRFTLRDLILDNLRSGVPGASAASLHLLTTLLADHCKEVTPSILTQIREPAATALAHLALPPAGATEGSSPLHLATNSRDANVQEPELYGALVPRLDDAVIGGADTASGFGAYLTDAYASLEADWCWQSSRVPLQFVSDDGKPALLRVGEYDADPPQHALAPSDPMVRELFTALTHWFTASPDTNIALTGAITALARCPHRSLAGWLLYDLPATDEWAARDGVEDTGNESDSSDDAPLTSKRVLGPPMSSPPPQPALYQVLRELVRHQGRFRVSVEGFDRLLAERRQGLLFADHLEEAMSAMLEADGTPPMSPMVAPTARKGLATNIKNLWSPLRNRMVSGSTPPPPQATAATPPPPVVTPASPLIPQGSTMSTPSTPQRSRVATPLPVPSTPGLNPPAPAVLGASPPFKNHYVQTAVAELDVESVAPVHAGPWAPIVAVAVGEPEQAGDRSAETLSTTASLSAVLDNCVVLEELIKELVALITARRALGIDQVGFI
jgi:hypothetical protein